MKDLCQNESKDFNEAPETGSRGPSYQHNTPTQKKPRLRDRTDRAWFSRLVRHPARKRSGSILTTPEPTMGPMWAVTYFYGVSHALHLKGAKRQHS